MLYFAASEEMAKLDALAVLSGFNICQMMESAGWQILSLFNRLKITGKAKVVIVCGKGNKGGDRLCATRPLTNHGWRVTVVLLARSGSMSTDSLHHWHLLKKMGANLVSYQNERIWANKLTKEPNVIIDALIGYRLKGSPRGLYAKVMGQINNLESKVIAYDLPTGVDATTGKRYSPYIKADATLALALP